MSRFLSLQKIAIVTHNSGYIGQPTKEEREVFSSDPSTLRKRPSLVGGCYKLNQILYTDIFKFYLKNVARYLIVIKELPRKATWATMNLIYFNFFTTKKDLKNLKKNYVTYGCGMDLPIKDFFIIKTFILISKVMYIGFLILTRNATYNLIFLLDSL